MNKMTEGYLCPECLLKLDSEAALLAHFEVKHGNGNQTDEVYKPSQNDVPKQIDDDKIRRVALLEGVISSLIAGTLTPESIPDISLKLKLSRFLKEQASLKAQNETLISRLTAKCESLLKDQSLQSNGLSAKVKELLEVKQEVEDLRDELEATRNRLHVFTMQSRALQCGQTDKEISTSLEESKGGNDFLQIELDNSKTALKDLETENKVLIEKTSILALEVQVQKDQLGEMTNTLKAVRSDEKILKARLVEVEEAVQQKNAVIESLRLQLQQLVSELEIKSNECNRLKKRLDDLTLEKDSLDDTHVMLNAELDETKTKLTCSIDRENALKQQLAESDNIVASHREQLESHNTVVSDLQSKLSTMFAEHEALMDQVIDGHNKSKQLESALQASHLELEGLQRIVLDLGRQNLSLQIIQERLSSRQWVSDASAHFCSNCQQEFTTSVRKHHCRHCGKVFCQACSSKKTATPASKDPLRVCDACFVELTGIR